MEFEGVPIVARGISVRGPQGCAIANVSLDVAAGQLAVIAGMAGSGRTSALLALAGRMRLVTGTVAVGGYRLPGDSKKVQQLLAVAPSSAPVDLDEFLTVEEHIAERFAISRTHPSVTEAFDILALRAPRRLRVGELRPDDRVLLAAALAVAERPAALVIDDVDRGCGPDERRRVWTGLNALTQQGCTVVATSTQLPEGLAPTDFAVTRLPHPIDRDRTPVPDGEAQR